jgi:hypothetical protein
MGISLIWRRCVAVLIALALVAPPVMAAEPWGASDIAPLVICGSDEPADDPRPAMPHDADCVLACLIGRLAAGSIGSLPEPIALPPRVAGLVAAQRPDPASGRPERGDLPGAARGPPAA